ncbi:acylphosphatase [Plebeiibacterium marinum]|uniref:acylphosphatase n=1 Tax=Plebeiibacterium marinum TaxID=2992111 RepID=A0AAE3MF23_9BACT|nr:acylphosphatase [Plebeiobacterium marinum]MCW3806546.1 acylphosphatase [Plebeiobacterium marinum]
MMRRVKMIVSGRVQGVGYRYFVQEQAREHGIKGYVRNLPGGEVEIDAEGERSSLGIFIVDCKKGPALSKILDCMIHDITPYGFERFLIRH